MSAKCRPIFLILFALLPAAVQAQLHYRTNNGAITITGYTGSGGAGVTIPDKINDLPVTAIGNSAFFEHRVMTSVTIPNSVTSIGAQAFQECRKLTSVTIPNSVITIGSDAFSGCANLTNITIPENVTIIGMRAFDDCTNLTAISVNASNSVYSSVDGILFNKDKTTLIQYPGGKTGSYTIPDSVTSIGQGAFECCLNLTNITIPNTVTSIGQGAFYVCRNLTSVTLPNSFTNIEAVTFYMCFELTKITIPASVTAIGDGAFQDCYRLSGVYFQGNAPNIGKFVFSLGRQPSRATIYYKPGMTGWGKTFGGLPTALWTEKSPLPPPSR